MGFLNPDVYSKSVKEFIKAREDGALQQDVFKAMNQAMLEHRLYGMCPEIAYRKHLGLLRRFNTIEYIMPKGRQAKQYTHKSRTTEDVVVESQDKS